MKDWSREDRRVRERLERNSVPAPRANRVADLNKAVAAHVERELPGLVAYGTLRLRQAGHTAEVRAHNRAHADWLRRNAVPVQGAGGSSSDAVLAPERRRSGEGTHFDHAESDPGNKDGSRFGHGEKYDPPQRAGRVRDADGSMRGGQSTEDGSGDNSDHWKDQGVHTNALPRIMTREDYQHMMSMRLRQRFW